ncbi:UNVERIFIED_CONTAM: hypothetical protein HDU68_000352, partial [Siphonaria sp. JEL0065]
MGKSGSAMVFLCSEGMVLVGNENVPTVTGSSSNHLEITKLMYVPVLLNQVSAQRIAMTGLENIIEIHLANSALIFVQTSNTQSLSQLLEYLNSAATMLVNLEFWIVDKPKPVNKETQLNSPQANNCDDSVVR